MIRTEVGQSWDKVLPTNFQNNHRIKIEYDLNPESVVPESVVRESAATDLAIRKAILHYMIRSFYSRCFETVTITIS